MAFNYYHMLDLLRNLERLILLNEIKCKGANYLIISTFQLSGTIKNQTTCQRINDFNEPTNGFHKVFEKLSNSQLQPEFAIFACFSVF